MSHGLSCTVFYVQTILTLIYCFFLIECIFSWIRCKFCLIPYFREMLTEQRTYSVDFEGVRARRSPHFECLQSTDKDPQNDGISGKSNTNSKRKLIRVTDIMRQRGPPAHLWWICGGSFRTWSMQYSTNNPMCRLLVLTWCEAKRYAMRDDPVVFQYLSITRRIHHAFNRLNEAAGKNGINSALFGCIAKQIGIVREWPT